MVPLPFLIADVKTDKIGGGDVKLMAASGFALGVTGGVWMMIWGLFMGLLWNTAFRHGKQSLPLAPFLAFGCFMTLMPTNLILEEKDYETSFEKPYRGGADLHCHRAYHLLWADPLCSTMP